MNYEKNYYDYMSYVKSLNRKKEDYDEVHHIIPKSLGGNNDEENLVPLTFREHYLAHYLLWKFIHNRSMYCAFVIMNTTNTNKKYKNSLLYEKARLAAKNIKVGYKCPKLYKKIVCLETGMVFASVREAAKTLNIRLSCISNCLHGRHETAGGCHWDFYREDGKYVFPEKKNRTNKKLRKKVICINTQTIYNSIKEAAKSNNLDASNISDCVRGKQNYVKGFSFSYYEEGRVYSLPESKPKEKPNLRKKIKCIETGEVFSSIKEAAEKTNGCKSEISACARGKVKKTKGFSWEFVRS